MGMLSDFVIADANSGEEIGQSLNPAEEWPTLQSKGVEQIKLAELYCAVTGEAYNDDIQASFTYAGGDQEEGPWAFKFPAAILETFASVKPADIPSVVARWLASAEMQQDQWSEADATEFITRFVAHAELAVQSKKTMFLWFSL